MNDFNNFNFQNKNMNNVDIEKYKPVIKMGLWAIGVIVLILIVFNSFTFVVPEDKQTVIFQFNEIKKVVVSDENFEIVKEELSNDDRYKDLKIVKGRGLFFKIPIIQKEQSFTTKLLTYATNQEEVSSSEKRTLVLDNNAQWKIINPVLYLANLGSEIRAYRTIDDILYSDLRKKIGKETGITIISDKDYMLQILKDSVNEANKEFKDYGIKVVDMRIRKTDLPIENFEAIYNRMRTERQEEANSYTYDGEQEAKDIRSKADTRAQEIKSTGEAKAQIIRGEGDAQALKIYAEAYSADLDFYKFWRTLEAYKQTMNEGTTIVLDSNTDFIKILTGKE
jgi:membrane protease subunit HflC